ncbi:MAG TPA: hypothetical protein VL282_01930 [Tepidisphaeraceae bacterium]|jgi:hypothetical protein|nr:hypothetical protein [Tepidisphaeraceae bacterium]
MTAASTAPPQDKPVARYLALWLIVQIGALALAAGRVPLSARFFQPAERLAVDELLFVQLALASLTFPLLLQPARLAFIVMITSVPMTFLANALSRYTLSELLPALVYLECCLLALAVWAHVLRTPKSRLIGVAVSGTVAFFGAILWYLQREYQPDSSDWLRFLSPLVGSGLILHQSAERWPFGGGPMIIVLVGIAVRFARTRKPAKM